MELRLLVLPLTLALLSTASTFADDNSSTAEQPVYEQRKDVAFADVHGVAITMDIFKPVGRDQNGLGIIDIASGGWSSDRGKIRDHKRARIYDIFCGRGYTVFAVRPGSISRFSGQDMVENIERAVGWVKDRADQFQIDPKRLGLTGASAGGHLASLVAVRNKTPVAATGVFFPPTDLVQYGAVSVDARSNDRIGQLVRALAFPDGVEDLSDQQITAGLSAMSSARQVTPQAPPFLLIHGDADQAVPLQQSERLKSELKKNGVPVELIVKVGGGHPWPTIHEEVQVLADWFDRQLLSEQGLSK